MTVPDVNEIKAGEYELVATLWDKPTSKPGEPFDFVRYRQGDRFQLDVDEARRLVTAGAVVSPGERQRAAVAQAKAQLQAALAQVPEDLRAELGAELTPPPAQPSTPPGGEPVEEEAEDPDGRPKKVAPKDAWVEYAVAQGAEREAADKLTKAELIAQYGG